MSTTKTAKREGKDRKATNTNDRPPPSPSLPPPQTSSAPAPPPALEIDSTSQLPHLAPPATPSPQPTQTATNLDAAAELGDQVDLAGSFPSLVQTLHADEVDESSMSSILEAAARIPGVTDEISLWNVWQKMKPKERSNFLAEFIPRNAIYTLSVWFNGFTPPKDKPLSGNVLPCFGFDWDCLLIFDACRR